MAPISASHNGRARALIGAYSIFLALPPIFVGFRLWARRLKRSNPCFNDYAIIAALVFASAYNVCSIISSVRGGAGQHMRSLKISELSVFLKVIIVDTLVWPTANTLVKLSVLHFYVKVFSTRSLALCAQFIAVLTLAYWLATIVVAFLICRPFAYNWDKITVKGTCGDVNAYYLSTAIVNFLIDVAIVALPLPLLWSLQMKRWRKLALTMIFSLGALICVISVVRIIAIKQVGSKTDVTYESVLDNICTALEPTLGVINACLPILQPVLSKLSGNTKLAWSKLTSTKGPSREKFAAQGALFEQSKDSRSRKFHQLSGDLYPLTDVMATQNYASGPGQQEDGDSATGVLEQHPGIKVRQDVGIITTAAASSR